MKSSTRCMTLLVICAIFAGGCATSPATQAERDNLVVISNGALKQMKIEDPSLAHFLEGAYGYAIFPNVGKGGFIAGGAYGRGVVYQQGKLVGYSDLTQATFGLQAGGQSYMELVVFEDKRDLSRFSSGKFTFAANLSAVALESGAAGSARYTDGVAVFVRPNGGLMLEAAIGGQQFSFELR